MEGLRSMLIIKIKESHGNLTIGKVFFSFNPFKVPFFSEVTWQCPSGHEKKYEIGSWMILYGYDFNTGD